MSAAISINWQTAPHSTATAGQIADVGPDRLYVRRIKKGARQFVGAINGASVAYSDTLHACMSETAKIYRERRLAGTVRG